MCLLSLTLLLHLDAERLHNSVLISLVTNPPTNALVEPFPLSGFALDLLQVGAKDPLKSVKIVWSTPPRMQSNSHFSMQLCCFFLLFDLISTRIFFTSFPFLTTDNETSFFFPLLCATDTSLNTQPTTWRPSNDLNQQLPTRIVGSWIDTKVPLEVSCNGHSSFNTYPYYLQPHPFPNNLEQKTKCSNVLPGSWNSWHRYLGPDFLLLLQWYCVPSSFPLGSHHTAIISLSLAVTLPQSLSYTLSYLWLHHILCPLSCSKTTVVTHFPRRNCCQSLDCGLKPTIP